MKKQPNIKLIHEGDYIAKENVELIDRDIKAAASHAKIFTLTPLTL